MADHPFDEAAVEAAAKALREHPVSFETTEQFSKAKAQAALTAACNSMKERVLLVDAVALWRGDSVIAVTGIGQDDYAPVTIIRHNKE